MNFLALILTFVTGLFFVLGILITRFTKNNERFVHFSISVAFGVILTLIIFELLPEALEYVGSVCNKPSTYLIILLLSGIGVAILKTLDHFIPNHDLDKHGKKAIQNNFFHIGLVSSIALILHNIIEGMAIYSSMTSGVELGILVMIGVGLHNIPMGMVLSSTLSQTKDSQKRKIIYLTIVSLSTFIGGILMFSLQFLITDLFLGILLSVTLGMLIYIAVFELLGEILEAKDKNTSILGILLGILIFILSMFFG